ncbi:hypothetical protein ACFVVM_27295 [Nocardia sp. NPDC058176]|uniref:hypothetical protein n=1 Tax=Nocardia sp. NPDC058176 TaxID=3346368 RepID=UPI0036DEA017
MTVPAMLWMAFKPSPVVQEAAAAEPQSTSAIEPDPIAAAAHYTELEPESGLEPVGADDELAALSVMKAKLLCSTDWRGTKPHVAQVGRLIQQTFGLQDIGGADGRFDGDHGAGLALDVMTPNSAIGDTIAEFVLANKARFGVTYVIWKQRYNDGNGWSFMEDRGSATQNHYDHVHVSFNSYGAANLTC